MQKSPMPQAGKLPADANHAEREPRGQRRKRETRSRLLEAALATMAEKGMEGVAINEITEVADVGFGSFYNHFESKEAIYASLVDWLFGNIGDPLDRLVRDVADLAEVISVSIRHTLLRAQREPVWGRFLIREGFSANAFERSLGQRFLRDIEKAVQTDQAVSGRRHPDDVDVGRWNDPRGHFRRAAVSVLAG